MTPTKSTQAKPGAGGRGSSMKEARGRVLFSAASLAVKRLLDRIGEQLEADASGVATRTHQQRIESQFRGASKGAALVQVAYRPDGTMLVTPISAPQEPAGRQRVGLLGVLQDGLAQDAARDVDGLVKLAAAYLTFDHGTIQDLLEKSEVSILPAAGTVKLTADGLVHKGDHVVATFDGKTWRQRHTSIAMASGTDAVTIAATYQTLPSGLTCCDVTEVMAPAKGIRLVIHSLNYQPQ